MKFRATVTLFTDSAQPKDACVNTWYFDDDSANVVTPEYPGDIGALGERINGRLTAFYGAVDHLLSGGLSGVATLKVYNLSDPEPRTPIFVEDFTVVPGTGALPSEIAICLSYKAEFVSGESPARRRGRVYLGPLDPTVLGGLDEGDNYVKTTSRTTILDAAQALLDANGDGTTWAVFSPTTLASGTLNDAFNDVVGGWVDNSFDIQRRRGHQSPIRGTFGD